MENLLHIGLDVGSTTVKIIVSAIVKEFKGYFFSKSSRTLQTVFFVSEKCL